MLREPKKNDVSEIEKKNIITAWHEDFGYESVAIEWRNGNRKLHLNGNYYLVLDGEIVGDLIFCTECESVFEVIAGNVYDGIEHCPNCGQ
jgi:hypothetical protein